MTDSVADEQSPRAILFMIVGPHSGFSLAEIFAMKKKEERRLGHFYWGYAGSLCHPVRVQGFAQEFIKNGGGPPRVIMVETKSRYSSTTVGRIQQYSVDGSRFGKIPSGVTLIGCTVAVTCANLRTCDEQLDLNRYSVADGKRAGAPLGQYVRYQINKACALLRDGEPLAPARFVNVVAVAELVEPYCVYLAE